MINKIQEPFERGAGTLLPVASLPSNYGIGTFGKAAYDFVDFLHKSGQNIGRYFLLDLQVMVIVHIKASLHLLEIHIL